jgi:O-antigen/teichoic acid export membrane protein
MWSTISRNALTSVAATAVGLAVGFAVTPIVVHRLGSESFGVWVLVTSLVGYFGLCDAGLGPTLVTRAAEYIARDDPDARRALSQTVSTVLVLYVVVALAAMLSAVVLAVCAERLFNVSPDAIASFRIVLCIVAAQAALALPMSVWSTLIAALQDFHVSNTLGVVIGIARGVLTVALLYAGYGLLGLVVLGALLSGAGWLVSYWWVRRRLPALRLGLTWFDRAQVRSVMSFSGSMTIWTVAGYALHQLDRVLIGAIQPVAALTTYEIGARLNNYSRSILHAWLHTVMPTASALNARREAAQLQELYVRGTRYMVVVYTIAVTPMLGFGREFIGLWMGPGFEMAATVLSLLLLASLYQSQNVVAHVMLPAIGHLRLFTAMMAIYPVVVLALGVGATILWGAVGMAAAILAAVVLVETVFLIPIARVLGLGVPHVLRHCQLPALLAVLPSVLWIIAIRATLSVQSWAMLALVVGVCLAIGATSGWCVALSKSERTAIAGKIAAWWLRLRRPSVESGNVVTPRPLGR